MKKLIIDGTEIEVLKHKWIFLTPTEIVNNCVFYKNCIEIKLDFDNLKKFIPIFMQKNTYIISDGTLVDEFFLTTDELNKIREFLKGNKSNKLTLTFIGTYDKIERERK